ncbi:MAG: SDR family NAD(P)-dependent oxidoreductase [Bryobacteraceae bacterium]
MSGRLQQKVSIITGAANGIGAAMARLFAKEGSAVVIADIDEDGGRRVAESIRQDGGRAIFARTDVSDASLVDAMARTAIEEFGGIDVLINDAVYLTGDTNIVDVDEAVWDRTIDVCLKGPFLCTKRVLPAMKERGGGSVITISSVNALFAFGETAYTAAKGGLISMMRLVAADFGHWKIRSNIICPGTISTDTSMDYWHRFPAGYSKLLEMYPMGRIGSPEEVANYAVFLASDESAFVSGSVCVVDGGLLAGRRFEF